MNLLALVWKVAAAFGAILLYNFFAQLYTVRMRTRRLSKEHGIVSYKTPSCLRGAAAAFANGTLPKAYTPSQLLPRAHNPTRQSHDEVAQ